MNRKKILILMLLVLSCFLINGIIIGTLEASESPEGIRTYNPSAIMVIQSKDFNIIRTLKNRFAITLETEIIDRSGKVFTLQSLPVPCEAEVTYRPYKYGDDYALKIVIRKVMPGASTNWSQPMPE